jgi:hypothetical protein
LSRSSCIALFTRLYKDTRWQRIIYWENIPLSADVIWGGDSEMEALENTKGNRKGTEKKNRGNIEVY